MPEVVQQHHGVGAPALGHHARPEQQFQQQVPADDPGDHLAQAGVGERVRRPGDRDRRGELGVAERGQPAADGRHHEAQHDGRPGHGRRGPPGQREDTGPDDDADAEDREVQRGQILLELILRLIGIGNRLLDTLCAQNSHGVRHLRSHRSPHRRGPADTLTPPDPGPAITNYDNCPDRGSGQQNDLGGRVVRDVRCAVHPQVGAVPGAVGGEVRGLLRGPSAPSAAGRSRRRARCPRRNRSARGASTHTSSDVYGATGRAPAATPSTTSTAGRPRSWVSANSPRSQS